MSASALQEHSKQADSNLTFLSVLKKPCEELSRLNPGEVAPTLERIISLVCIIWWNSPYYHAEQIAGLFSQVPGTPPCS